MGAQPRRGPCGVTTGTGTQQQHLPQVAVQHGGARVGGVLSPDTLGKPPGASGNLRGSALGLRDDLGLESTTRRHRVSPAQPPQTSNRSAQLNMTPEDRHTFWRAGGSTGSPVAGPPPRPPAAKHVFPAARPQFLAGARHEAYRCTQEVRAHLAHFAASPGGLWGPQNGCPKLSEKK